MHSVPYNDLEENTLNQTELVAAVAETTGMTKVVAAKLVDAVTEAISGALKAGDEVRLTGFGTFSVAAREARQGRNPRTGETIKIAASKTPKFSAGKGLKDSLNA